MLPEISISTEQAISLGIAAVMVLAVIIVGRWLVNLILGRLNKAIFSRTQTTLDDRLMEAARVPLYWILVVLVVDLALRQLFRPPEGWGGLASDFFYVAYMMVGFWFAIRVLGALFDWYAAEIAAKTETEIDDQILPFARRIAIIIASTIAAIMVLGHFEVDVSGLVATLGVGSLAVALAAQAALDDTISGITIMTDQRYRIGDRIEIMELETWGDVIDIGLRSTRIRTLDNRMIIVPNSLMGKNMIINHTLGDPTYRIRTAVGVAYGTDIDAAREIIREAVLSVDHVVKSRPVEVLFEQFGASSLDFRVRWWIDSYDDIYISFDKVNTAIYNALNEAGIEIPFPQRDLNHKFSVDAVEALSVVGRGGRN